MIVQGRPKRDVSASMFADLITAAVVGEPWWSGDSVCVEFDRDLTAAEQTAVIRRIECRNLNEETLRQRAEQAMIDNRAYLLLAPPSQSQAAQQITALTRQVNALIRIQLGELDGTD